MTDKKDPLDDIFMNKEQTEWFRKGKKQAYLEMKRKNMKPQKLTIDQNKLIYKIEEQKKRIKCLEEDLDYFKKRHEAVDIRLASIMGMEELKAYPKLRKIILKKATKVIRLNKEKQT